MIRHFGKTVAVIAAILGVAVAVPTAKAGMIPTSVSVAPDGDNFRWTYAVVVTTDVKVNPGDSFTIYDFAGLVQGSIQAADGWSVSTSNATTPRAGTNPKDNPAVPDFTFTWTGSTPIEGQAGLGNFWAVSTLSQAESSDFTSTTHRQVDGRTETNITTTDVPINPPPTDPLPGGGTTGGGLNETPEPATLALIGAGLPVLGLVRVLRSRKKK